MRGCRSRVVVAARVRASGVGLAALAGLVCLGSAASGAVITNVNVTGTPSNALLGDASNAVLIINYAPGTVVTGLGWNVTQTAYTPSWLADMKIQFSDSTQSQAFSLTPGGADTFPGTGTYSSGGVISLSTLFIPNLALPNGQLRLEFYEAFDDLSGAADGIWAGTVLRGELAQSILTIETIPTPGSGACVAVGAFCVARRRRR